MSNFSKFSPPIETQIFSTAKYISNSSEQELYHRSEEMTTFLLVAKQTHLIFKKLRHFRQDKTPAVNRQPGFRRE